MTAPQSAGALARVGAIAASAGSVYGLIVVSGVVVVSRNLTASSAEALVTVVATLLVFFAAHAYAASLGHLADARTGDDGTTRRSSVAEAVRHGIRESIGMLAVGLVPVAVLLLGVVGAIRPGDAVWLALLVDVALLGVLGWAITAARVTGLWARLGGALLTAGFGAVIVALKVLIH